MEKNFVELLVVKQWPGQWPGFKQKDVTMNAWIFVMLDTYLDNSA